MGELQKTLFLVVGIVGDEDAPMVEYDSDAAVCDGREVVVLVLLSHEAVICRCLCLQFRCTTEEPMQVVVARYDGRRSFCW